MNHTLLVYDKRMFLVLVWFFCLRLAQERQVEAEQRLQRPAAEDKRQKLLDSLRKAGVDNFTMKAAVPGTEIPGHKVRSSTAFCSNIGASVCVWVCFLEFLGREFFIHPVDKMSVLQQLLHIHHKKLNRGRWKKMKKEDYKKLENPGNMTIN